MKIQRLTITAAFFFGMMAWAGDPKLSSDLPQGNTSNIIDVIVQYRVHPGNQHWQEAKNLGGTLKHQYQSLKAAHYTMPVPSLHALAANPDVTFISPDRSIKGKLNITAGAVHSDLANQSGYTGAGIAVAVIDSGIANMPSFATANGSRIIYSQSFTGDGITTDLYGHGTHVAGILGASGSNSIYRGIAPAVNIVNFRVLDQNGVGTDSNVIAAIDAAIRLAPQYNIRVINLSLGRPVFESVAQDPLCQAVEQAWQAGIVVVAAAGNDGRSGASNGYGTINAPGNDPFIITVGAMKTMGTTSRTDDLIATYSSKGPTLYDHFAKPDLVAPGNKIISTLPAGLTLSNTYPQNSVGGGYFSLSGTSMATPVVSAAAAILLQQHPNLNPEQVKARLMRTATKNFPASSVYVDPATGISYTSYYDTFTVGSGYLDITAALGDGNVANGSARTPYVNYNSLLGVVSVANVAGSKHLGIKCHLGIECHLGFQRHLGFQCHLGFQRHLGIERCRWHQRHLGLERNLGFERHLGELINGSGKRRNRWRELKLYSPCTA